MCGAGLREEPHDTGLWNSDISRVAVVGAVLSLIAGISIVLFRRVNGGDK